MDMDTIDQNYSIEMFRSGVVLSYTDQPQRKRAGVYFVGTNGMIPARTTTYMEAACRLATSLTIHPFAFRTHTHALGRVVSGWKVTEDMEWSLIGKQLSLHLSISTSICIYAGKEDPQKPQMFYPVEDSAMTLTGGDTVAARCTMVSYRDRITWVTNSHLNIFCPSKHSKHYFHFRLGRLLRTRCATST